MAANSMNSARCTPLIAAFPKMLFPVLVILPGLIAIALPTQNLSNLAGAHGATIQGRGLIPAKMDASGSVRDETAP
jgi:SSS family solute:Na+ symporter